MYQIAIRHMPVLLVLACVLLAPGIAAAELFGGLFSGKQPVSVEIADPYIELRTGPGPGYPVFHVEERGAQIDVLLRKTDWFKVQTGSGKTGWVARSQLERTLTADGEQTHVHDAGLDEFRFHRWETGAMGGDFEDADVLTLHGSYFFTPNMSVDASISKIFAEFSDADMADISLSIHPFSGWRWSPFVSLGTGVIRTDPKTTLVQERDRTDQLAHAGAGIRFYVSRRFVFRAQYKNYVIFQSVDDNQEINEWKAGFSVFF